MTKDEIIRMAEEAGFKRETTLTYGYPYTAYKANIERFAALVAAHEREACAKVVDTIASCCFVENPARRVVEGCAAAIRARSEK